MKHPILCKALVAAVEASPFTNRVKLPWLIYLADLAWSKTHGKAYTEATYYRWNSGSISREILESLQWLYGLEVLERYGFYVVGPRSRLGAVELDPEFLKELTDICRWWGQSSEEELQEHMYESFGEANFGDRLI